MEERWRIIITPFETNKNMDKYNKYYGIFFLIMGIVEMIFTIANFSITQLAFTLAVLMCGFLNFELYKIKRDALRGN